MASGKLTFFVGGVFMDYSNRSLQTFSGTAMRPSFRGSRLGHGESQRDRGGWNMKGLLFERPHGSKARSTIASIK